jgi:hypothetical protein
MTDSLVARSVVWCEISTKLATSKRLLISFQKNHKLSAADVWLESSLSPSLVRDSISHGKSV